MGETEEFNTLAFEKKLLQLKDTQESIQGLSSWCLKQREHHKKIVASWLNVLKRVKVDQRLTLFYLANDVIQYSKRKNYDFVESWGLNLQKATPLVRDDKVRQKILRIFKIWEQRSIYDEEFLTDLTGLLSAGAIKKTDDDPSEFQPQQLVNKIKQCTVLEADTDLRLKQIHECPLQLSDTEELSASLKERCHKDDVERELNDGIGRVERYTQALQREIVAREALLALLTSANHYYSTQRGEVKVVAYAYKNFGARVRALKRKLDELVPTLKDPVSPPPREEDVPSPEPDDDIHLPNNTANDIGYDIDKTFNTSLTPDGSLYNLGLSSFLSSGENPLNLFQENSLHSTQDLHAASESLTSPAPSLPALDLLTPEPAMPRPPTNFYAPAHIEINDDRDTPYSNSSSPWNVQAQPPPPPVNNVWNIPATMPTPQPVPPPSVQYSSPPASPPHTHYTPPLLHHVKEIPTIADVDHRGMLPPPPPPPVLPPILGQLEDVDHRLLPPPPPPHISAPPPSTRSSTIKDVDHRNLISLTHQLPAPSESSIGLDQDYRVPPTMPPPDIVESVDMDLSEDEEHSSHIYPEKLEDPRLSSYHQNNKVLVGGDNGKTNHNEPKNVNLIRINSLPNEGYSPKMDHNQLNQQNQPNQQNNQVNVPPMPQPLLNNPFANVPPFKFDEMPNFGTMSSIDTEEEENERYDEDHGNRQERNESPRDDYEWEDDQPPMRPNNQFQRFPRPWNPGMRPDFRPEFRQFWPRNGPRTNRPWMGPRPPPQQRFW